MRRIRLLVITLTALGASGCSLLPGLTRETPPEQRPQPLARTDRFALPAGDDGVVGEVQIVIAKYEDTLSQLARRFDLGYEEIRQANPAVDPWLPGEGTPVILPTQFILPDAPREGIVLNVANMRLFYYPQPEADKEAVVVTHPIGIGRSEWPTPTGETHVRNKVVRPSWYVPPSIRAEHAKRGDPLPRVVPPGDDNPLGEYALLLDIPGYLIHGTNKPAGVGMQVSHGCIRLYPEDIEALFAEVPIGTPVRIVDQPYLAAWRDGTLYFEAHPPLEGDDRDWDEGLDGVLAAALAKAPPDDKPARKRAADMRTLAGLVESPRGIPLPISQRAPDLEAVLLAAAVIEPAPEAAETDEQDDANAAPAAGAPAAAETP